jgi:outer membrane protein OmpA-like peptidoglycan-associated protein
MQQSSILQFINVKHLSVLVASLCALSTSYAQHKAITPLVRARSADVNHSLYQVQRDELQDLIDTGTYSSQSYALSKSRCWLDASFHEYTRNDRSNFAQDAYTESKRITQYLAKQPVSEAPFAVNGSLMIVTDHPATQTLLLDNSQRLRSDLWSLANEYKQHPNYGGAKVCAEAQVACAEVYLSHAGHEINDQGWRHARPYIQLAENELHAAKKILETCTTTPAVTAAVQTTTPIAIIPPVLETPVLETPVLETPVLETPVVVPPVVVPPVIQSQKIRHSAEVLFNFDKRDLSNVRDYTKQRLDSLIAEMKAGSYSVERVELIGHADRSNQTGNINYNTTLSKDRVILIKQYMISQGINSDLLIDSYKGDSLQVEACTQRFKNKYAFQECLLPNRRVEVIVNGTAYK